MQGDQFRFRTADGKIVVLECTYTPPTRLRCRGCKTVGGFWVIAELPEKWKDTPLADLRGERVEIDGWPGGVRIEEAEHYPGNEAMFQFTFTLA